MIFIQIYNGSHENNMEMRVMEKMLERCSRFDVRAALARLTAKFKGEEEQDDNVDLHDEKNNDEAVRQIMWNGQSQSDESICAMCVNMLKICQGCQLLRCSCSVPADHSLAGMQTHLCAYCRGRARDDVPRCRASARARLVEKYCENDY